MTAFTFSSVLYTEYACCRAECLTGRLVCRFYVSESLAETSVMYLDWIWLEHHVRINKTMHVPCGKPHSVLLYCIIVTSCRYCSFYANILCFL